jgi:hypothetical protein
VQQIQDSLVLSANALPEWCHELTSSCPMMFPFETRLLYFQCTAFGASRSIVWLQNQRDQNLERSRSGVSRGRDEVHEFRVGRIKHERVKVPRGEKLLEWAIQVIRSRLPDLSRHNVPKRGKIYQIATKLPNGHKMGVINSKWPKNIPTFSIPRPSKIYPNWDFWF